MTFGEKRKTVLFNLDNPEERAMYELAAKTNFSKFVKRFMATELQRMRAAQQAQQGGSSTVQYIDSQRVDEQN